METKKTDRRIQRTRQLMREALISLILEKGFEKITVQNIIDRANVGRSTFYDHFQDKQDLLEKSFGFVAEELDQHMQSPHHHDDTPPHHLVHSIDFFQHAYENRDIYKAMAESGGGEVLMEIGRKHMENNIQAHLSALENQDERVSFPLPAISHYLASTLMALITWWQDEGGAYTPEEMDDMFNTLAMPGVWQALSIHTNT